MKCRSRVLSLAFVFLVSVPVHATTLHVPAGYPTIQAAMNASLPGDSILVASGSYHESLSVPAHGCVLRSEAGAAATTIDADGVAQILTASGTSAVDIRGFTLMGGFSGGSGGGLDVTGGILR